MTRTNPATLFLTILSISSICSFQGANLETFSSIAQWQSTRLLTEVLQVRALLGELRLHGQVVKTSPFHGGNSGSNPDGVIFLYGDIAKW